MSYTEYHDTLSKFARLRVRPSTLPAFGFHSEDGFGWLYTVPIDGTPLECHVSISAKGVVSERGCWTPTPGMNTPCIEWQMQTGGLSV